MLSRVNVGHTKGHRFSPFPVPCPFFLIGSGFMLFVYGFVFGVLIMGFIMTVIDDFGGESHEEHPGLRNNRIKKSN